MPEDGHKWGWQRMVPWRGGGRGEKKKIQKKRHATALLYLRAGSDGLARVFWLTLL